MNILHAALLTLFPCVAIPAQQDVGAPHIGPLVRGETGAQVHDWLTRTEAFGMHGAVLVEQDGEVILHQGYGIAERNTGRPITWRTRFDIGSLGKQFTATAVAEQVRLDALSWHSTLGELLPDVMADKSGITVHQLLTHTSGLPYMPGAGSLLDVPLQSEPGTRHSYSNVGYAVLAEIVATVSRRSLEQVTRDLLVRASIPDVGFTGRPMDWDDQAHGYVDGFDWGTPEQMPFDERYRGAGGHACTVGELHRWVHALEDGDVLDRGIVQRMLADHVDGPTGYGYGWFILQTTRGTPLYRHMGTYNGFNSELRRYREEERTIVFLSNTFVRGRSMRDAIVNRIGLLLAGMPVPEPPQITAWDDAEARGHAGTYRSADGTEFTVDATDDALSISSRQQEGWNTLFGVAGHPRTEGLITSCANRSLQLVAALRQNDRRTAEALTNPGWVGAYRDLSGALARVDQQCGGIDKVEVLGTAVRDVAIGNAVTIVEMTGERGQGRLELVWTANGALGSSSDAELPGQRMLRTGDNRYAAFDLFTGIQVECEFDAALEMPSLTLRSGDTVLRAGKV